MAGFCLQMEGDFQQYAYTTLENAIQELQAVENSTGWEIVYQEADFIGMRKAAGDRFVLRGLCQVPCPAQFIVDFIKDYRNKPSLDKNIILSQMLCEIDDNVKIIYCKIDGAPIISIRDNVVVQGLKDIGDTTYIANKSIEFEEKPPVKGVVRADAILVGYVIKRLGPNRSQVSYVKNVDPRGKLPTWLVNLGQKKQSRHVLNVRKCVMQALGNG